MIRRDSTRDLRRRAANREPKKRILIVCEGEKTETLYFGLFLLRLREVSVDLEIFGKECGSDPLNVVEFAVQQMRTDGGYDNSYCVIDRDSHDAARFNQAIQLSQATHNKLKRPRSFKTLVSYPCIEFWFVLHFEYTRAPFVAGGAYSPGDLARKRLELLLPDYSKSNRDAISKLLPLTDNAVKNAMRVDADVAATGELNPSTGLHLLVGELQKLCGNGATC